MKLYSAITPNCMRVRVFLAEKGLDVPLHPIDVQGGETRTPAFLSKNTLGELPLLQLDDGDYIAESMAICRYFEERHPTPALFGTSAKEQAIIEMWNRRIELHVFLPIGFHIQHTIPFFADKVEQVPDYADSQRRLFEKNWAWLDKQLSDGRPYIAGDDFSVADITGVAVLTVCSFFGLERPESLVHAKRWERTVLARESVSGAVPKAA